MMYYIGALALLCLSMVEAAVEMAFVFELVRHGARGPFVEYDVFPQGEGQLTG
jgi:hypothetical protein